MKYVTITGGLGNQMFIYAFCEELRARGNKTTLFVQHRINRMAYGHQGYELEKLFGIQPYDGFLSKIGVVFLYFYSHFLRFFPVKHRGRMFGLVGIKMVSVSENFIFYPEVFVCRANNELFRGTWQSELYFEHATDSVRKAFIFREKLISEKTISIARQMKEEMSVSIHIRRGDYLSNQYVKGFADVCTPDYYLKAIDYMKNKLNNPRFYVLTDDKEWVNEHFKLEDAFYIQHNTGSNSWQDMYLMSQCKHNIIANSSFSWWGAWLNSNKDKIVIAPKLWWKLFDKDDVVPASWIRL